MKLHRIAFVAVAAAVQSASAQTTPAQETAVPQRATGTFDVTLAPQPVHPEVEGVMMRMSLDKQFHGDLEGSSRGEMLATRDPELGSGGYVAIEKVTGTLGGRSGSFVLQHDATMTRGEGRMNIIVTPDSGTGELAGLTGSLQIIIEGGQHSYVFEYTLP
jgi:hypothetical protein